MPLRDQDRHEHTQSESYCLVEILASAPLNEEFKYSHFFSNQAAFNYQKIMQRLAEEEQKQKGNTADNDTITRIPLPDESAYSGRVWVQKIMPLLAYLGFIQADFSFPDAPIEAAHNPVLIHHFQITEMGHLFFDLITHIERSKFKDDDLEDNFPDDDSEIPLN
jgi:hypothetical protein